MAQVIYPNATSNPRLMKCSSAAANSTQSSSAWNEQHEVTLNACSKSEDRYRQGQVIQTTSAGSYLFSAKRYSCCASRKVRVRRPSLSSITKDKPIKPGTSVTNAVVPSSFLRDATADFHSPKSKRVSSPTRTTAISPSER